jgi:hypothetical protein
MMLIKFEMISKFIARSLSTISQATQQNHFSVTPAPIAAGKRSW